MNLRFVDLRLGDSLAVILSPSDPAPGLESLGKPSASCEDRDPGGGNDAKSICLRTRQQFRRATGFSRDLCFLMEPDQPGQTSAPKWSRRPVGRRGLSRLTNRPGKLAAVTMPTR